MWSQDGKQTGKKKALIKEETKVKSISLQSGGRFNVFILLALEGGALPRDGQIAARAPYLIRGAA